MKKIVVTNAYTWYNKGDAGILLGIINLLRKKYGNDIDVNILSFTPEIDAKKYCHEKGVAGVYHNILNPFPFKHTKFGKIFAIIKLFFRMIYLYIGSKFLLKKLIKKEKTLEVLNNSDLIIVCGGGFLGGKKYDSFMHLFQMYMNTLFHKKVIALGISIEPMKKGIIKKYTEKIIRKIDFIFAREYITYEYLKTVLPSNKFELIPDMAFMLEDKNQKFDITQNLKSQGKSICGITVRKWDFPQNKNPKYQMENYIQCIAKFISYCNQKHNMIFIFIPQVIVEHASDTNIIMKIKKLLDNPDSLLILQDDYSPTEIKGLISNFDYFVGTRMHSNIFATSMLVPTLAISYEMKTDGIMKTVGMEDFVLKMENLKLDDMIDKMEKMIKEKSAIYSQLKSNIPNIRNEIMEKTEGILL